VWTKELLTERKLKIFGKLNTQPKIEGERFPTLEPIIKKYPILLINKSLSAIPWQYRAILQFFEIPII